MNYLPPTSVKEVKALGWEYIDVILFTGDAFVDHPSFGAAVIARTLQHEGYRVAVVPQPNWRDDLRDFKKLGPARLFFGVSAGAMDSMVNHYTATRRLRSDDAYTPDKKAGARPDYPTVVYTQILKKLFPDVPVVVGGIEASLRRLRHYDYWQDRLRPSILVDSGADWLIYGMGEKPVVELAYNIAHGLPCRNIRQVAYITAEKPDIEDSITLSGDFAKDFIIIERESNRMKASTIIEPHGDDFVVVNPPYPYLSEAEIDQSFDLPYTRLPHPRYAGKGIIAAYEMIKHSVNIHRGCFGGCSFCTISAHQGKFISSRSEKSILSEVRSITQMADFRGTLSDVGGPSANMWHMGGVELEKCSKCVRSSCIFPKKCLNLHNNHNPLLVLYDRIAKIQGVKNIYIGSGIRYDMVDDSPYMERVIEHHTSGRLKVAPEHTEDRVLALMRKPSFSLFEKLYSDFKRICAAKGLPYQLVPYFISSHPGCTEQDMNSLCSKVQRLGLHLEQVQDFTPTPMTLSSVMYFTGEDPTTGQKLFVARGKENKDRQKSYFFRNNGPTTGQKSKISLNKNQNKKWK
ncbi:MAG: YgiQ family radical SAM protein [Mucinivorans sp.]